MKEVRKYQRYAVDDSGDALAQFEVTINGESVRLVNFSLGGLYVISRTPFPQGTIDFSVDFGERGIIALTGTVVRVKEEEDMWGLAIDFSKTYELGILRKL